MPADAPQPHPPTDVGNGRNALDALLFEQQALDRRQPGPGGPYREQCSQREQHTDQRLEANGAAEQLQRHQTQKLAVLLAVVAACRQGLAPRPSPR